MTSISKSKGGFSLVELLVVLSIVGILAAVGIYQLTPRSKPLVRQLTEQLFLVMNEARQLARTTGSPVTLRVTGATPQDLQIEYICASPTAPHGGPAAFSMKAFPRQLRDNAVPGIGVFHIESVQPSLESIKELGLIPDFDGFWVKENSLFQGADAQIINFSSAGQISQSIFITIGHPVGVRNSALGLIILTPMNGGHAFYLGSPDEPWKRI